MTATILGWPSNAKFFTPDEQAILRVAERGGQAMTQQRIALCLAQAIELGDLPQRPGDERPRGTLAPVRKPKAS